MHDTNARALWRHLWSGGWHPPVAAGKAMRAFFSARAERRAHRLVAPRWALASAKGLADWRNPEAPLVSIVIPVFNQIQVTLECLRAVLGAAEDPAALELIVVDDASTEPGVERLRSHPGITYQRNPENVGFVGSCNTGAGLARGRFLVFLNSDTLVTPGWLEPLLTKLDEPGVGLVGARLQYPDGRLQEAGGLVFADGSGWNYGRGGHPGDPRYLSRRDVHYCSGAALALTRERFLGLGGFDPLFAPGYYEDTDLAMRVRDSGARVVYEPESVVVHMEGMSAGTDIARGMKSAQAVNRGKFFERWQEALRGQHPVAGTEADLAVRQAGIGWVVAYASGLPDERFLTTVESLAEHGCAVDLFLDAELPVERVRKARACGVTVWPRAWRATGRWLLTRNGQAARAVLTDGSPESGVWLRQVGGALPVARRLSLAADAGPAGEDGAIQVGGAEDILPLLEA